MAKKFEVKRACIICEKVLIGSIDHEETQSFSEPPDGATVWNSEGNWGSTVYDQPGAFCDNKLEIVICDECLVKKQKFVLEFRTTHKREVTDARVWEYPNKEFKSSPSLDDI